ncbi:glycosyltransferase [Sphingomonas sp.]|uniref:glycosyltransferase n=1 Tax=Sphingomonas sp. TaxID=28214 RepID=UPI002EDBA892
MNKAVTEDLRSPRPRMIVVINSIGSGGAERALDRLLRGCSDRLQRYDVELVLLDHAPEMRALPPLAAHHCLDARGSLVRSTVRLAALLRRRKPDLLVSLLVRSNMAAAVAGPMLGVPTILCERMHLTSHLEGRYRGVRLGLLRLLPRLLYGRAAQVLAVSQGVADDLVARFGVAEERLLVIPNPYDIDAIVAEAAAEPEIALPPDFIVAVGRLVAAKGFDDLIRAYAIARPELPLLILGEGAERMELERQASDAGLSEWITFAGYLANPFAVVGRATYLVSASHNEGFPNAIAEAMVLGRPVLATDCPSGPAELLGGRAGGPGSVAAAAHGLIVPDADVRALAAGMDRLRDSALRERLGAAARARMEAFRSDAVTARYWAVFDRFLGGISAR